MSAPEKRPGRLHTRLARRLGRTRYAQAAIERRASLDGLRIKPSPRFFLGLVIIGLSYVLGWPMVALFGFIAAYLGRPWLVLAGPACYAFSHLLFLAGLLVAGRDTVEKLGVALAWGARRFVEGGMKEPGPIPVSPPKEAE